jgi:hypothetical protein
MNEETRARLQADLTANRRSEYRLLWIAAIALGVVAILVVIRLVFFS